MRPRLYISRSAVLVSVAREGTGRAGRETGEGGLWAVVSALRRSSAGFDRSRRGLSGSWELAPGEVIVTLAGYPWQEATKRILLEGELDLSITSYQDVPYTVHRDHPHVAAADCGLDV